VKQWKVFAGLALENTKELSTRFKITSGTKIVLYNLAFVGY